MLCYLVHQAESRRAVDDTLVLGVVVFVELYLGGFHWDQWGFFCGDLDYVIPLVLLEASCVLLLSSLQRDDDNVYIYHSVFYIYNCPRPAL